MSLALVTKGVISGFMVGGEPSIAVLVCKPELTSEEYRKIYLRVPEVSGPMPKIYSEDLNPSIKIYDSD